MVQKVIEAEYIYASVNYTIIGSDNDVLPDWCQAIIWTNPGMYLWDPYEQTLLIF